MSIMSPCCEPCPPNHRIGESAIGRAVKVYSYIVTHDSGFSPNPFHGFCTLACCKPAIRRTAEVGDLIIGLASLGQQLIYAMKVSRVIDFAAYWDAPQYRAKRPSRGTHRTVDKCGDNIYEPSAIGEFRQLPSLHSNSDGTEDAANKRHDLDGVNVLVSEMYSYFGHDGPAVPHALSFLKTGRGHRCRFTHEQVAQVSEWFATLPRGVHGRPAAWKTGDESWRPG